MSEAVNLIVRCIAWWSDEDVRERATFSASTWTQTGACLNPMARRQRQAGIDATATAVRQRLPARRLRLTSNMDAHNGQVRLSWAIGADRRKPLVKDVDFGFLTDDGRRQSNTGFLDQAPG